MRKMSHVVETLDGKEMVSLVAISMSVLLPKTITVIPMPTAQIMMVPSVVHAIQVSLVIGAHVSTMMNVI